MMKNPFRNMNPEYRITNSLTLPEPKTKLMSFKENLDKFDLAARKAGLDRKGKTVPYTSSNGYMHCLLNKEGEFGIRLSKEDQAKFKAKYESGPLMSHGATMRDYVLVPDSLLANTEEIAKWMLISLEHVNSLPPKQ